MTITSKDKTPSGAAHDDEPREAADVAGNLDKVRDILFGVQMRDVDRRFAHLEERLTTETADLKEDLRRRLADLEQFIRAETSSLAERLSAERSERTGAVAQLDEHLARAARDLRQQILEQGQRLSEEIRQKTDEVLARLASESRELRADKADRSMIASLLTEVAMRLNDDLRVPGLQDLKNG